VAWCHRGRAGTASPCHGGISWASSKCFSSSLLLCPSWNLLYALLELTLLWPYSPGACAGQAHLELALAMLSSLCCTGVSPQACTCAMKLSWLWCVFLGSMITPCPFSLLLKLDHACLSCYC
jgi:hypothetical protein